MFATSMKFIKTYVLNPVFWWLVAEVTPDPIPNSEVKLCWGDDTLLEGKVASRRNFVFKKLM